MRFIRIATGLLIAIVGGAFVLAGMLLDALMLPAGPILVFGFVLIIAGAAAADAPQRSLK